MLGSATLLMPFSRITSMCFEQWSVTSSMWEITKI
jgi:hypothetical protein